MGLDVNGEKIGLHNWIQLQRPNGSWKHVEANMDRIDRSTPVDLLTQPLCVFENGTTHWRLPVMTITQRYNGKRWAPFISSHVMPE
jgi:hypothetical protein